MFETEHLLTVPHPADGTAFVRRPLAKGVEAVIGRRGRRRFLAGLRFDGAMFPPAAAEAWARRRGIRDAVFTRSVTTPEDATVQIPWTVCKVDDERQRVFGFASVAVNREGRPIIDLQDDIIEPAVLEEAAYDFVLSSRASGENHEGEKIVGRLIESMFFTPEKLRALGLPADAVQPRWWVGFHIADRAAWTKVKSGEYAMFSIQGVSDRVAA
jgi:hypothetical protein